MQLNMVWYRARVLESNNISPPKNSELPPRARGHLSYFVVLSGIGLHMQSTQRAVPSGGGTVLVVYKIHVALIEISTK